MLENKGESARGKYIHLAPDRRWMKGKRRGEWWWEEKEEEEGAREHRVETFRATRRLGIARVQSTDLLPNLKT